MAWLGVSDNSFQVKELKDNMMFRFSPNGTYYTCEFCQFIGHNMYQIIYTIGPSSWTNNYDGNMRLFY